MICPDCRESVTQVCAWHHVTADNLNDDADEEIDSLRDEVARLTRERDEARQARRMAEQEVEMLRARIRGDG